MTSDHGWERHHLYRPSVIYESSLDQFRMHYTAIATLKPNRFLATCYAGSDDGFVWHKPLTDRFLYQGRPTNIVGGPAQAIKTSHDPQRPYIGVFNQVLVDESFKGCGVSVASSIDGIDWGKPCRITETKCDTVPSIVWYELLAGFERERARLVRRDDLRYRVVWRCDGADRCLADAPRPQPLIIRFVLNKGKLFAFQIV